MTIKAAFNRRMRKTARPVVWEGAGAQSSAPDPIPWLGERWRVFTALMALAALLAGGVARGQGFDEDFQTAPSPGAWRRAGDAGLFVWDAAAQALRVTWDSARPNTYFGRPLRTVLNRYDDFSLGFTVTLDQVTVGVSSGKPYTFELAVGFLNWGNATNATFRRGTGASSPNLVEWAYFPDSGYGATVWPTVVGRDGRFNYNGSEDFTLFELVPGPPYRVELQYTAADQTLRTRCWRVGTVPGPVHELRLAARFTDFAVDTFAICSYSDAGAQGSLRASGWVDDIVVRVPPPPLDRVTGRFSAGGWQVGFAARTNWTYALERTIEFEHWFAVATNTVWPAHGPLELTDLTPPARAAYRVQAIKP